MATEYVSVVDLSIGDIVVTDGIKVELQTEHAFTSTNCGCGEPHEVKSFDGRILNWNEVQDVVRGLAPDERWTVQGNHLAHVWRVGYVVTVAEVQHELRPVGWDVVDI